MNKSLKKNYFYNLSYQLFSIVCPLITAPYLSRVLGVEGVGIFSYHYSIVVLFSIVASFGITVYARRQISYNRDDSVVTNNIFWTCKYTSFIVLLFVLLIYIIYCFYSKTIVYGLLFSQIIISEGISITFLYQAYELFGVISLRNFIIKLMNIVSIFLFVKKQDDLLIYIFITCFYILLSNAILWIGIKKFLIKLIPYRVLSLKELFTCTKLFIPLIAEQTYMFIDKIMIGNFYTDMIENGYYEQATKIVRLSATIIVSLATVMSPRIAYNFKNNKSIENLSYMYKAFNYIFFIGVPMTFGLFSIANIFMPSFFGENYVNAAIILKTLSFIIIPIGINAVVGIQYLIHTQRENKYLFSIFFGIIINITLNTYFIPQYGAFGASIASIISELLVAFIQIYFIKNEISILKVLIMFFKYCVVSIIMYFFIIYLIYTLNINKTYLNIICISSGILFYLLILYILKDKFLYNIINIFKNKIAVLNKRG